MDLKMLLAGIDISEIESHIKEVIDLVKNENAITKLNDCEDKVYILLDIRSNDIIAYRVTTGVIKLAEKNYIEIKRTLGKWALNELKNLIGEGSLPVENTLRKILPIINGFISLTKLEKDEKRISIQIDITGNDITSYLIALGIITDNENKNRLVVNRILGKYNLNEYIK